MLALVINSLIIMGGLAAFLGVEVRELPNVDQPVLSVDTDYTGASAERPSTTKSPRSSRALLLRGAGHLLDLVDFPAVAQLGGYEGLSTGLISMPAISDVCETPSQELLITCRNDGYPDG